MNKNECYSSTLFFLSNSFPSKHTHIFFIPFKLGTLNKGLDAHNTGSGAQLEIVSNLDLTKSLERVSNSKDVEARVDHLLARDAAVMCIVLNTYISQSIFHSDQINNGFNSYHCQVRQRTGDNLNALTLLAATNIPVCLFYTQTQHQYQL